MLLAPLPHPTEALRLFAHICDGVRRAIVRCNHAAHPMVALFSYTYLYVLRASRRLDALFLRWKAGKIRPPRPRAPRKTERKAPAIRLPAGRAWLARLVPGAGAAQETMHYLMADPEFAAFAAEVPAALRILRPFSRAVGFALPAPPPAPRAGPQAPPAPAEARADQMGQIQAPPDQALQPRPDPGPDPPAEAPPEA